MELISATTQTYYRNGIPVMPGRLPVLGHVLGSVFGQDPVKPYLHARETLGPLFWMNFGLDNWVLICAEPEAFEALRNKVTTSEHYQDAAGLLLGKSLVAYDGRPHHHMRSALNGPFTPRGMVASEVGKTSAEVIEQRIASWPKDGVTILHETQLIAIDIIFRIMGIAGEELEVWRHHYGELMAGMTGLPFDLPFSARRRGLRARAWLEEHQRGLIARARAGGAGSFMSSIVNARDEEGNPLSERELLDNLLLLALAGHETTAGTMAWLAITLAQRPELYHSLSEEVKKGAGVPRTPQELKALPFAEALFRETLRRYSPAPVLTRMTTDWLTLCHHRIPPKTTVGVPVAMLGRHPSLYADPEKFDPGRWLGKSTPPTSLELVQFGGGPHFCLGYHLAWMEVVQFAVAFAEALARREVRPQLADGPAPVQRYRPLGHPPRAVRINFVR
jgi:cytochrome P450 monooxygenase